MGRNLNTDVVQHDKPHEQSHRTRVRTTDQPERGNKKEKQRELLFGKSDVVFRLQAHDKT